MKYQSELVSEILEQRGHELSSLHYESECIEQWIEEYKGAYPKLCDYQSEWLNYINENPIGEFPYVTLSDVTDATVNNTVPYAYKSAILTGSTKYRDIDTGEILETFEEGRNLELVSVKMPVLTTVGKNLVDDTVLKTANLSEVSVTDLAPIKVEPNKSYYVGLTLQDGKDASTQYFTAEYKDENGIVVVAKYHNHVISFTEEEAQKIKTINIFTNKKHGYSSAFVEHLWVVESSEATPYEPYKTNILSCLEPVELGSVGEVKDELNLLTQQLTQRTETRPYQEGDELNSEFVTDMTNTRYKLAQEVVKTVELNVTNQDGETLHKIRPIEGTMHLSTDGETIKPSFTGEIPIEAITQNLASFIEE